MKLLELYDSIQGEGPNVGRPTTFIRFAGCNMRCPGWPCDTPYAIEPTLWRKEFETVTPYAVMQRTKDLWPRAVCITGGEPLLQPHEEVRSLIGMLLHNDFQIDIFTNGSRELSKYSLNNKDITIVMDWKLQGSGEAETGLEIRKRNLNFLTKKDAVKFVVKDADDMEEAYNIIQSWGGYMFRIYIAPAWGVVKEEKIVEWMTVMSLSNVYLNVQVHKHIWSATARRT